MMEREREDAHFLTQLQPTLLQWEDYHYVRTQHPQYYPLIINNA